MLDLRKRKFSLITVATVLIVMSSCSEEPGLPTVGTKSQVSGYGPLHDPPPETVPELYAVNLDRSIQIQAQLDVGDWSSMGGPTFLEEPDELNWPAGQSRKDANIIEFRTHVSPDYAIVDIYYEIDPKTGIPIGKVEEGITIPDMRFECRGRNSGCFISDGQTSSWAVLPVAAASEEYVNVFASWIVRPPKPGIKPTVEANWGFHFVNE